MTIDINEEVEVQGKFLSASRLRITEEQRCGLIKALAFMEAGKLTYLRVSSDQLKNPVDEYHGGFNMSYWQLPTECGIVCCIAGAAALLQGRKTPSDLFPGGSEGGLEELFLPRHINAGATTPKQAAVALRGFLETGRTNWAKAMESPK